jgi:Xaa-Pro dipeptidase
MLGYSLSAAPIPLDALYTDHIARLQDGHAQALDTAGFDALLIHAGRAQAQSPFDDQFWPHKPTPAFAHWLPLLRAEAALLVQPGKKPRLFHPVVNDYWDSEPEPESEHFWQAFDEIEIAGPADIRPHLPARVAFIGNDREPAAGWDIPAEAINPAALVAALDLLRAHKTDYERCCMGEANRRAARGHQAVLDAFAGGVRSELELHLLYLQVTGQDDWQTPYKNIVAMDENAAVLHHVRYRRQPPPSKTQSLLIDAGATCMGYASDVTRTAVKGEGAALFAELIRRVEALQAAVIQRIEPGLAFEDLHDHAHELLAPILRDLGIASASEDELVGSGATRHFLPHGLGHSLGIQVHDVGCRPREPRSDNPFLRNTSVIEPGQVFTIEPGCYFVHGLLEALRGRPVAAAIDWEQVDLLARFGGVRIEDNIAMVEGGTSNLTRDNWPPTP